MGKKIIKRALCVLLVLSLMFVSSFSTFYFFEVSLIYSEVISYVITGEKDIEDVDLKKFYSKDYGADINKGLDSRGYTSDINDLMYYTCKSLDGVIVRAKYLGRREARGGGKFKFKVNDILLKNGKFHIEKGEKIRYFASSSLRYYTFDEIAYHSYGTGYEKGEEYLLFLDQYTPASIYSDKPTYYHMGGWLDRQNKYQFMCINKLSGEYPSIKMFPGPVEYDATYFGAKTKYVTADEFVELFMKAVNDYSAANGLN